MDTRDEIIYRMGLTLLPQVGVRRTKVLLDHFGSGEAIFRASTDAIREIPYIGGTLVDYLTANRNAILARAEREMRFMEQHNIQVYCLDEPHYPALLAHCPDAPTLLYGKGNITLTDKTHLLAVVGTRQPSERGKEHCRRLILDLAERVEGLTIVSGLAYGVDICAHKAALEAGIPTIIIPAHGLDRVYPAIHRNTAVAALQQGGILTEYMSETTPERANFVERNRIIAGMTEATLVVESKSRGGSLITADLASGYGRSVLAMPGAIDDEYHAGCNRIIKEGQAQLVENAEDVINFLSWPSIKQPKQEAQQTTIFATLSPTEEKIMQVLQTEREGVHVNTIVVQTGLPFAQISSTLMMMELRDLVRGLPGNMWITRT